MKESKTTYSYLIEHMDEPSFDKVWDIAFDFVQKLPSDLCDELHESLNRGIDILDSEPLLQMYIYSFGKMHNAKLQFAFNNVQKPVINNREVELVDYGCGQGLASICYHDFIIKHNCDQKVRRIILIEPSEMALSRAELLCSQFYPNAEIIAVNKQFDDLTNDDLILSSDVPTIHLLSNILDVESYDLDHLSEIVKEQSMGDNEYVMVSPMQNPQRIQRLRTFASSIDKVVYFEQYLEKRQFDEEKDWTCAVLLCSDSLKYDNEKVYDEASSILDNEEIDKNSEYCKDVFNKLKLCAEKGDRKCQNMLGLWYEDGVGTSPNFELAFKWFNESSKLGYEAAFLNLGLLYSEGKGVYQDFKKAVDLYTIGAEMNHAGCQLALGECYYDGSGVSQKFEEAFIWFKKAANQGVAEAYYYLYLCYIKGVGTDKDAKAAIKALNKAAKLKDPESCYVLARFYNTGTLVEKKEKRALLLYKKSAELGYYKAQEILGKIYKSGLLGEVKNPKKSFNWYLKAAEQGSASGQFYVGYFYSTGYGTEKDPIQAFEWYSKSAQQNNSAAINNLAYCYEIGKGVGIDLVKAVSLYEKAAKLGNIRAKKNVANCYRYGKGVNPDAEKYFYWILDAAKNNDLESIGKIAYYYFLGFGTEKSNEDALMWYARYYTELGNDILINSPEDAFNIFKSKADEGNSQAIYILGKCMQYGIVKDKDFELAHTYYKKAAELGHIESIIKIRETSRLINLCSIKKEDTSVVEISGMTYSSDKKILIKGGHQNRKELKIPFGTRIICDGAFYNHSFTKIVIPSTVLFIGKNPFSEDNYLGFKGIDRMDCYSANYIVLDHALYSQDKKKLISYFGTDSEFSVPLGVEIIGEEAFAENSLLTEIKLPSSLQTIEDKAFQYCLKLYRVTIPENVTSIGMDSFYGCESLCEVRIDAKIKSIPIAAFMGCNIEKLILPDELIEIANYAFHSNEGLRVLKLPDSIKKIGYSSFAFCNLNSITLSDNLEEIGDFCFFRCPIERLIIPSKVNIIGLNPFIGTKSIVCESNNSFVAENGLLYKIESGELITHFEEEEIALFHPMRKVKSFAFYGSQVKDILIGKNIVELEPWAFYEAEKLKRVRWQKSKLKEIPLGCFGDCSNIETIEIPGTVEIVQVGSFFNCKNLKLISFEGESTKASNSIFCREDRPEVLPDWYWPKNQLMGSCIEERSEREDVDISSFKKIEILVPFGCKDNYKFTAIYDHFYGDLKEFGMDRDFIIKEHEQ